ncbi:MAG: carboxypeptidase regulatory-like domain-containing protein [Candidatus Rokubacteria bacterium]|nr:carboxypeptidase regulatory-like domain-containing protein [Candidatus Rokubacteria bacterium]
MRLGSVLVRHLLTSVTFFEGIACAGFGLLVLGFVGAPRAVGAYEEAKVEGGGSVHGTVTFAGSLPTLESRPVTRDPEACGKEPKVSDALLVSPSGKGVKNVVAFLEGVRQGKPFSTVPAELDQRGCWFVPHVVLVRAGQPFTLVNSDGVLHNFRTPGTGANPAVNKAQPKFKKRLEIKIDHPDIIPVNCDVHEWMHAVVVVMAHPYYALTDEHGAFALAEVPPGRYTLTLWHERLGKQTRDVVVTRGGEVKVAVELKGK